MEDAILIQAEVLDLKANPNRRAEGVVIESKLDKSKGVLATLLVQKGTLYVGDIAIINDEYFNPPAANSIWLIKQTNAWSTKPANRWWLLI